MPKVEKSDAEWQRELTPEEYRITRQKGTEPAFTGIYWNCHESGVYRCKCCDVELFDSDDKYDSGCGWPSFDQPVSSEAIRYLEDESHNMRRIEIRCGQCDAHLGHVFPDGPKTTGERYCVNSASLSFIDDVDGERVDG